jgi:hypothetical protein
MSQPTDIPATGTEISFVENNQTRRGWIVCREPGEVGVYPLFGEESESRTWPVEGVQVLDEQEIPEGWEALRLESESSDEVVEVRLHTNFMDTLRADATRGKMALEDLVLDYLRAGLDIKN